MYAIILSVRGNVVGTVGEPDFGVMIGRNLRDQLLPHEWSEVEPFVDAALEGRSGAFFGKSRTGQTRLIAAQPVYGQHRVPQCVLIIGNAVSQEFKDQASGYGVGIDPGNENR